jgi:hypothetical protein
MTPELYAYWFTHEHVQALMADGYSFPEACEALDSMGIGPNSWRNAA